MGDDEREKDERESERREGIEKFLPRILFEMSINRMGLQNLTRIRKVLEEVVEEEEEKYGRRGGLERSAMVTIAPFIYDLLKSCNPSANVPWGSIEETVHCFKLVLRRVNIKSYRIFSNFHSHLLELLPGPPTPNATWPQSEELIMHILACLSEMCHSVEPGVREKVWGQPYRGKLGHTIYLCLNLSKTETNKALRLQAIQTVQDMGWKDANPSLTRQEKDMLSGTFVNFLPGILQAMTKVAKGSSTQGSKITGAAVDTWTYFTCLVMRDSYLCSLLPHLGESKVLVNLRRNLESRGGGGLMVDEVDEEEEEEAETLLEYDDLGQPTLPNTKVTCKWARSTGENIGVLAAALTPLATHIHWRVRLSMARWAAALVTECVRSLPSCLSPALEVLLTLRQDEMEDVAEAAVEGMRRLGEAGGGGGGKKLEELMVKKVMSVATRLPSIVRQEDDATTLGAVRQIEGCLEVLGGRGVQLLLAAHNAHRLLHSLALLLALDTSDSNLLLQRNSALDPFEVPILKPHLGRSFTHFQDKRVLEGVCRACGLLGRHGGVMRLGHMCTDLLHLHTSAHLYSEGLLLLSLVLDGVPQGETDTEIEEHQHIVQLILDEVLSPDALGSPLPCTLEDEHTLASFLTPLPAPSSQVEGARARIIRVIQALGVVGACARLMGRHFTQFLSTLLCPVMEFAGLGNMAVSYAATDALKRMSEASGCPGIGDFIRESAPHLWYPLSMRLKRFTEYPASAIVLQVALRYTGTEMQAFTEELVEEALTALDQYHVELAIPMLRVLLAYVSVVAAEEGKKSGLGAEEERKSDLSVEEVRKIDVVVEEVKKSDVTDQEVKRSDVTDQEVKRSDVEKEEEDEEEEKGKSGIREKGKVLEVERMEEREEEEEEKKEREEENIGAIAKFLQEYHDAKMNVKIGLEEDEEEVEEDERRKWEEEKITTSSNPPSPPPTPSPPPEPTEPTPPRNIELVRDVVDRCSYLLHVGGREGRLLTLEVARWGCRALRNWENLLLPCTHKLWRPILLLLSQPDPVVGTRTLALVSELVALSGDFLRRRVLQEALPLVLKFLESQANVSAAKECLTPSLKAQISCLATLMTLIPALQLRVTEAGSVVGVVGAYLDPRHTPDLFRGAMGVLRVVSRSHPHHVWLALAMRRPAVQLVHPSPCIPAVKIGSSRHHGTLPAEAEELFQELS
ncbi:uncharacterized protein LOC126999339 [Eriocheir sinensis]|uniref:uncharacterized protein LOC126999339 n=1 Tax=Eriocheir sinensis TaxID=95602 RepID=UPI0021CA5B93|nr:uncharacterized protein LOC126999339 [Eriocheir sinensis]XP_050717814.1 uncharacterized protein LOC126999339 [Eriocheir sinensis]XP_050717815.1 uncharacterized protein LOC126999339 [Eriocheir sinensis]XP_050717816.1 uncharacterized protein LOC126999339 [Eriocheir sinensis]XP_050717817.1 uncharacterized protein LOC126999339 [Eriocheir sinensis]